MASKLVFIGGVENAPPLQELIAQKPYRSRVKEISYLVHFLLTHSRHNVFYIYSTYGDSDFSKINISRNIAGENDVTFDLKYCGICHTDVNVACNDGGSAHYPCVPGNELAGVVTKFKVGDR